MLPAGLTVVSVISCLIPIQRIGQKHEITLPKLLEAARALEGKEE